MVVVVGVTVEVPLLHIYVLPPVADNTELCPAQMVAGFAVAATEGEVSTDTVTVLLFEQPFAVPVTV